MKITSKFTTPLFAILIMTSAGLLASETSLAIGKPARTFKLPKEGEPAKKEKKSRAFTSLNNNSVKIYPDAIKREMHVLAKDNDGRQVNFFVFDLQGTLISNYKLNPKDHIRIAGLARGSYVYRVFTGDEETAAGKFEIR
jgi:hypothetical protein